MTDRYYSPAQASEIFPLSEKTLHRACRRGEIGSKVNGKWVIKASELDAWYERCKAKRQPRDPELRTPRSEAASLRRMVREPSTP